MQLPTERFKKSFSFLNYIWKNDGHLKISKSSIFLPFRLVAHFLNSYYHWKNNCVVIFSINHQTINAVLLKSNLRKLMSANIFSHCFLVFSLTRKGSSFSFCCYGLPVTITRWRICHDTRVIEKKMTQNEVIGITNKADI